MVRRRDKGRERKPFNSFSITRTGSESRFEKKKGMCVWCLENKAKRGSKYCSNECVRSDKRYQGYKGRPDEDAEIEESENGEANGDTEWGHPLER